MRIAVDQNAPPRELLEPLAVAADPCVDRLVVSVRCVLEFYPLAVKHIDRAIDVGRGQGYMLNAFPLIGLEVFLDLALIVLRLIDGVADASAGARERARE